MLESKAAILQPHLAATSAQDGWRASEQIRAHVRTLPARTVPLVRSRALIDERGSGRPEATPLLHSASRDELVSSGERALGWARSAGIWENFASHTA